MLCFLSILSQCTNKCRKSIFHLTGFCIRDGRSEAQGMDEKGSARIECYVTFPQKNKPFFYILFFTVHLHIFPNAIQLWFRFYWHSIIFPSFFFLPDRLTFRENPIPFVFHWSICGKKGIKLEMYANAVTFIGSYPFLHQLFQAGFLEENSRNIYHFYSPFRKFFFEYFRAHLGLTLA